MFYWQRVMRMTFVFQFLEMNQDQLFFFLIYLFSQTMVYLSFVDFEI